MAMLNNQSVAFMDESYHPLTVSLVMNLVLGLPHRAIVTGFMVMDNYVKYPVQI
jgi:hypothetical protein